MTTIGFSSALCLLDHGAYVQATEELVEVQRQAPGSALVEATLAVARAGAVG